VTLEWTAMQETEMGVINRLSNGKGCVKMQLQNLVNCTHFLILQKDEQNLPHGRHSFDRGTLVIDNIDEEDRGVYTCTATNEAATISVDTELLIENIPPRAPYNLTGKSTDTTITLKWVPGNLKFV
jgi:hypothetical protein